MIATCIGCGCDDRHACPGGCWWLRVDYREGLGVCSECSDHVEAWDLGDRTLHAVPAAELEDPELQRVLRPEQPATGQPCNGTHDWPFEDTRQSDTCRRCGMTFLRHIFTELS